MGEKRVYKGRKLLITAGVYESEVAEKVQDTFEEYRETQNDKEAILSTADILNLSKASVTSYLPYQKGVYFPGTASKERIFACTGYSFLLNILAEKYLLQIIPIFLVFEVISSGILFALPDVLEDFSQYASISRLALSAIGSVSDLVHLPGWYEVGYKIPKTTTELFQVSKDFFLICIFYLVIHSLFAYVLSVFVIKTKTYEIWIEANYHP